MKRHWSVRRVRAYLEGGKPEVEGAVLLDFSQLYKTVSLCVRVNLRSLPVLHQWWQGPSETFVLIGFLCRTKKDLVYLSTRSWILERPRHGRVEDLSRRFWVCHFSSKGVQTVEFLGTDEVCRQMNRGSVSTKEKKSKIVLQGTKTITDNYYYKCVCSRSNTVF